jgi:hypothetical protein
MHTAHLVPVALVLVAALAVVLCLVCLIVVLVLRGRLITLQATSTCTQAAT